MKGTVRMRVAADTQKPSGRGRQRGRRLQRRTAVADNIVVVMELGQGANPISTAELDMFELYFGDILDEVLSKQSEWGLTRTAMQRLHHASTS